MVDLRGFEYVENTGVAVSGATVTVYAAVITGPHGAAVTSTTTNPEGMWSVTGLPDGVYYDVKLEYSGQIQWYKGESKVNVRHVADDETPDTNQNLIPNGGMTGWSAWTRAGASGTHPLTGNSELADNWAATVSGGDSATGTRAAPTGLSARYVSSIAYTRVGGNLQYSVTYPTEYAFALRNQTITVTIHVKQGTNARLKAFINDGVGETAGTVHTATGSYAAITVTRAIDAAATALVIGIKTDTPAAGVYAIEVGNAVGDYGAVAPTFVVDRHDRGLSVNESERRRGLDVVSDVAAALSTDTVYLSEAINMLARQTRLITGGAGWKTAPTTTLISLAAAISAETSARNTALALKLNLTGGAMSGSVNWDGGTGIFLGGNAGVGRTNIRDFAAQGLVIGCHNTQVEFYDPGLTTTAFLKANAAGVYHSGNLLARDSHLHTGVYSASGHDHTDKIDTSGSAQTKAGSLTVNGTLNAGAVQQSGVPVSLNTHNHAGVYDVVGHTHSNPSGMAKIYSLQYTGDDAVTRAFNTGITPYLTTIMDQDSNGYKLTLMATTSGILVRPTASTLKDYTNSISGTTVTVSSSSGMNTFGRTYNMVVLGV